MGITSLHSGIADLCTGVIRLLFSLEKEKEKVVDGDALFLRFDEAFKEFDAKSQRAGVSIESISLAKYALCALVDEKILTSNYPAKEKWSSNPLQLRYFDDFSAGEEFYTKLERLRSSDDLLRIDVLEVYGICLALGFRGKFSDIRGQERRRILLDQVIQEVNRARGVNETELSLQPGSEVAKNEIKSFHFPMWLLPLCVVLLLLIIYFGVQAWIHGAVENFSREMGLGQGAYGS